MSQIISGVGFPLAAQSKVTSEVPTKALAFLGVARNTGAAKLFAGIPRKMENNLHYKWGYTFFLSYDRSRLGTLILEKRGRNLTRGQLSRVVSISIKKMGKIPAF